MARIIVVGEGMVELSPEQPEGNWRLGHGGDMLNSAIHLARLGHDVAFATALGGDGFSADLRDRWAGEGLDLSLVLTDPSRNCGLYAIRTDPAGERSFTYWRETSAARRLFELPGAERVTAAAEQAELLLFSLISLAILPATGRAALLETARRVRARGARVGFDGNYRPPLWPSPAEARAARDAAIAVADIGLPTIEDERVLAGQALDPAEIARAWRATPQAEVVVKLGADGAFVDGAVIAPPERLQPVDTSGAGDAFDAAYLDARLAGEPPAVAALCGHRLAGWAVMHRGGIPARDGEAPY